LQELAPGFAEYFPVEQFKHDVAPLLGWYVPVGHKSQEFIVIDILEERPGKQARHVSVTVSLTCPGGHPHSLRFASQYNPLLDIQSTKGPHEHVPLLGVVPLVCMHDGDRLHFML